MTLTLWWLLAGITAAFVIWMIFAGSGGND